MAKEEKKNWTETGLLGKIPSSVLGMIAIIILLLLMVKITMETQDQYFDTCGELCEVYDARIGIASKHQCTCLTQDNQPLTKEDRELMSIKPGEEPIPEFLRPYVIEDYD